MVVMMMMLMVVIISGEGGGDDVVGGDNDGGGVVGGGDGGGGYHLSSSSSPCAASGRSERSRQSGASSWGHSADLDGIEERAQLPPDLPLESQSPQALHHRRPPLDDLVVVPVVGLAVVLVVGVVLLHRG